MGGGGGGGGGDHGGRKVNGRVGKFWLCKIELESRG